MHDRIDVKAFHAPRHPLTPSLSPTGGEGVRRAVEGERHQFIVPMHADKRMKALRAPQGADGILPAEESEKRSADETSAAPY
jgi:hypothetical protein